MPLLNFAPVLTSVYILDSFDIHRRAETVGADGLASLFETTIPNARGIVTQTKPEGVEHRDDGTIAPRSIDIITRNQLRSAAPGFQADVVVWSGDYYTVTSCQPYPRYPMGWYEATATITTPTAQPL
jgi:hypothetical protein